LAKGARDRLGEERLVSALLLAALAEACFIGTERESERARERESEGTREEDMGAEDAPLPDPAAGSLAPSLSRTLALPFPLLPGEHIATEHHDVASPLGRLLAGEVPAVLVLPDGEMRVPFPTPAVVFPGAFNPLHRAHRELAHVAAQRV